MYKPEACAGNDMRKRLDELRELDQWRRPTVPPPLVLALPIVSTGSSASAANTSQQDVSPNRNIKTGSRLSEKRNLQSPHSIVHMQRLRPDWPYPFR